MPKAITSRVLVKIAKHKKRAGGIYFPEDLAAKQNEARQLAEIVELGPGAFQNLKTNPSNDIPVKVGDKVYISRFSGIKFENGSAPVYEDFDLRMIWDEDILAIHEEGDPI